MNAGPSKNRYHTLVVTVENKFGVLARVAGLFARRGFNIESLAVAPTDDEDLRRPQSDHRRGGRRIRSARTGRQATRQAGQR